MEIYRRRLPHWQPEGAALFVTWRIHGSVPPSRFVDPVGLSSGCAFVCLDQFLDRATYGPVWLGRPDVAQIVVDALRHGELELKRYRLHAWVVMPNHAHVLYTPLVAPSEVARSIKGFSARAANLLLDRTGEPFWQRESYDRWVRSDEEFSRIHRYIEKNPVRAGLARSVGEFRWSSGFVATDPFREESRQECRPANVDVCPTEDGLRTSVR